ncbi:MAG: hypothetical protein JWM68_156 [Verrucomicrobiales bacterium]|nr:hypothetical protein [Verrucomicrobiales bacterium]
MPIQPFPIGAKEQFDFLVEQAERYIKEGQAGPRAFKAWRNRAIDWLKQNARASGLASELLIIPEGNVQRSLRVFLKVRPTIPFLRDKSAFMAPKPKNAKKVFIVHGHNDALKNTVARFVSKLDLDPVILHEQPNKGRTIIEKFIDNSDVGFAVVLLTPDDKGGSASNAPDSYKFRARQNVILELGFFLGSLGRERVAAIFDSSVEMPSDYSGVLFLPHDSNGSWQFALAKEMREAGLPVDLNKL